MAAKEEFTYVRNKGVVNESAYTYKGVVGTCNIPNSATRTTISSSHIDLITMIIVRKHAPKT